MMFSRVLTCAIVLMLAAAPAVSQPGASPRVKAEALFVDAQKALSRGDYTGAETILKEALQTDPSFTSAIWQLAQIYESRGEIDYARELLMRGLRQDPEAAWAREKLSQMETSIARAMMADARGLMSSGSWDDAIQKLSAYLDLRPRDAAALAAMARCHFEKGNQKAARKYIDRARAIDPDNAEISSLNARMETTERSARIDKLLAQAQIALLDTASTAPERARTALGALIEADPANEWAKERLAELNRPVEERPARAEQRAAKPLPPILAKGRQTVDRSKDAVAGVGRFLLTHIALFLLGAVLCVLAIDVRRKITRRSHPLEGTMTLIPILDIVSLINANLRTGRLIVVSADAKGEIFFDKGEIVHARCDGLTGKVAFQKLMDIRSGRFFFHNHLPNVRRTIADPLSLLLLSMKPHEEPAKEPEARKAREEALSSRR
jgi:tetratricopeptide (TPR) repeat protein